MTDCCRWKIRMDGSTQTWLLYWIHLSYNSPKEQIFDKIHKCECVKPLLLNSESVFFPSYFPFFLCNPSPNALKFFPSVFTYTISLILHLSQTHIKYTTAVFRDPSRSPFNHRGGKEAIEMRKSSDHQAACSSHPKSDLKASNQKSQTKEAAASHHGQSHTDLLHFQSDADWFSCCLWWSEQLNV